MANEVECPIIPTIRPHAWPLQPRRCSDSWLGHRFPFFLNELNMMRDVGGHFLNQSFQR